MPFAGPDRRQKILVLLTMCFALFMAMLDNTVVNVALPTISSELGAGVSGLQWIVDGYVLAFAAFMLTGGILGDRYGRKKTFIAGLAVFTVASLLCGLSQTTGQLIGFRVLQGVGAAMLQPGTLAILTNTFPINERAQAIGIWAGVSAVALALGPTVGGWVIENVNWQSVFFLNVPIGIAGIAAAIVNVKETKEPNPRALDLGGLVLGTAGLTGLVYGLIEANQLGWASPVIIGSLLAGVGLLLAFVVHERRTEHPMFPLALFKNRAFSAALVVAFSVSFAMFGTFFFASLYFQVIRGYSAFGAGVRLLPATLMIFVMGPISGRITQRVGSRLPMTIGLTMAGTGLLLYSRVQADSPYFFVAFILTLQGFGMGLTMTPMTSAVMNAVGPRKAGLGSAMSNTGREVGGVFGVALLGTLLTTVLRTSLTGKLASTGLPPGVRSKVISAAGHGQLQEVPEGVSPRVAELVDQAVRSAFMDGFHLALLIGGIVMICAAVLAYNMIPAGTPEFDVDLTDADRALLAAH